MTIGYWPNNLKSKKPIAVSKYALYYFWPIIFVDVILGVLNIQNIWNIEHIAYKNNWYNCPWPEIIERRESK